MAGLNCRRNNGFSLLELVIAIGIISTGLVFILQALGFSARAGGLCGDYLTAVFLAEDKLQSLEFQEKFKLIEEGSYRETKMNYELLTTISPQPDLNLYKLDLDITWQRRNKKEEIKLTTCLKK